jgi:hypothetical protein
MRLTALILLVPFAGKTVWPENPPFDLLRVSVLLPNYKSMTNPIGTTCRLYEEG